jgi:hypothetical protein
MEENTNKLTAEEKMARAVEFTATSYAGAESTESRSSDVALEFIRLEVQIATLLFVFMGFFVNSFVSKDAPLNVFWIKVFLSGSVLSLLLSLLMGLLHLKLEENFWDMMLNQRLLRFLEWTKVTKRETSFEEAEAFHKGTALDRGNMVLVPTWTWVLQSIFLGIGITTLFILFLAYIFTN